MDKNYLGYTKEQEKKAQYLESIYELAMEKTASVKKDDKKRDKDTSTKMWRDRVKPELKRDIKALPQSTVGLLAGGLAGSALTKGHPMGAALGGTTGAALASYKKKSKMSHAELDRLSDRYLGGKAPKKYKEGLTKRNKFTAVTDAVNPVAPPLGAVGLANRLVNSPEAMIQQARREKAAKKNSK